MTMTFFSVSFAANVAPVGDLCEVVFSNATSESMVGVCGVSTTSAGGTSTLATAVTRTCTASVFAA